MLTMEDIGKLSGVSRVTVSAVLNGRPGVSEKTRQKVLAAIREKGGQYGRVSRMLLGHFSRMIAGIVPSLRNPFYTEVIAGLQSVMKDEGYYIVAHGTEGSVEDESQTIEGLLNHEVGGFVLEATAQEKGNIEHIEKVIAAGKPLVTIGPVPGVETNMVDFEDRTGSKLAADYLIERGHRDILCLAGPETATSAKERILGFIESLIDHRIPFQESMVVRAGGDSDQGYQTALRVLRGANTRPTALLCFNDLVAIGAYRASHELGLRIPDDIGVIGFDDVPIASVLGPPLTTVSIFPYEIGRQAAEILLAVFQERDKSKATQRTVVARLVERGSVKALGFSERKANGAVCPGKP